ncbi:MAG: TetR/AcrR family transcriptional regulator [Alphaproteobacteria bacterium]|jgi:TetR/AcrR family transcriptional regulator, cholesterol catabolism regulator|nr:TetR/AcrR family transcriptional regulator [Alphaproteobacteria bacterium]MBT4016947.1 TetR/AcrR family transcriptional regulator [Alphaproteobacteria bacterium]MBT4965238.1 TetR/AcrR family transcriptional regulator [Alphaproteobacteria bacterium]MBT5158883.1 TetR/AcrR family transcriptional regulator [Alphaproteobacteria bacterium]MBT6387818.1 TetR/AcrR family transcriptional regulator [Alphaproteobacteria bacterium]
MPRAEKSQPKRLKEIRDAAASVFAEKGFHGASTRDIADRLGIKQAGLYHYFSSKNAALTEVCRMGVEEFHDRARDIANADMTADEKITAAIAAHMAPFHQMPDYVKVFLNERRYLSSDTAKPVTRLAASYEKVLQGMFEEGVLDKTFQPDLDCRLVTLAMLGLCNSVLQWYRGSDATEITDIAHKYAGIIVGGVKR